MTIKHVAVCAECDKEVPAKLMEGGKHYAHPADWLKVEESLSPYSGVERPEKWFCTFACLAKYAGRNGP